MPTLVSRAGLGRRLSRGSVFLLPEACRRRGFVQIEVENGARLRDSPRCFFFEEQTHLVVFIPWPPLPGVDGSTRRASRSRAAVVCSGPAMTAGARKGTVQVEEPPPGMDPCHRAGRALPRSRSTVAHPAIGGRARQRRGPRRCHHLPRFSHRCWSLTDWPPRFTWSRAVQSRRERGRKIVGARVSGDVVGTGF
jgi:hypothetical protein